MSLNYDAVDAEKCKALENTTIPLKVFSTLNVLFDVIFTFTGMFHFASSAIFITLMAAALASTLCVVWYANEAYKYSRNAKKAPAMWFWENSTLLWKFTGYKFLLLAGFIVVVVLHDANVDAWHILACAKADVFVPFILMAVIAVLMAIFSMCIVPQHHLFIYDIMLLFDAPDV